MNDLYYKDLKLIKTTLDNEIIGNIGYIIKTGIFPNNIEELKDFTGKEISDGDAIKLAMEDRFTIGSSSHNGGLGLGNIRSSCTDKDILWIVSNKAILAANSESEKIIELGTDFAGTLVFYSMSLSHFDDEEVLDDFNW